MPHIIVKCWPGRSEEVKKKTAEKIAMDVAEGLSVEIGDVSVAFEEVAREDWRKEVYEKDICARQDCLYKKPDY